eukprot:TRINITY_DN4465_c0_g1_i4.p2 TRINITY_DN4465_c0_g1~~TRINITY_DN4465_c0_g1_i4.p2  ORF type:complete len:328 (+),score=79.83 TRINITY_DN4465_c0_g1_i4:170-1153(+)
MAMPAVSGSTPAGGTQVAYPGAAPGQTVLVDPSQAAAATAAGAGQAQYVSLQPGQVPSGGFVLQPQVLQMPGAAGGGGVMPQNTLVMPGAGGTVMPQGQQLMLLPSGQMVAGAGQQFVLANPQQQAPFLMQQPQPQMIGVPPQMAMAGQQPLPPGGVAAAAQPQLTVVPQQPSYHQVSCPVCNQFCVLQSDAAASQFDCPHCRTRLQLQNQNPAPQLSLGTSQLPAGAAAPQGAAPVPGNQTLPTQPQVGAGAPGVQQPAVPGAQPPTTGQPAPTSQPDNSAAVNGAGAMSQEPKTTHRCPACEGMFRATKNQGCVSCPLCAIRLMV